MFNPLVSVIIPNYCHAKYLDQRIQSVINQTYQNFEVIILDDASPDNGASISVIEKYRTNPHVSHIVYNEKNSGSTFKQWNKGFELAQGDLIWIAESDDYCEMSFLETLVPLFKKNNKLTMAYSGTMFVNSEGIPYDIMPKDIIPQNIWNGKEFIHEYMLTENWVWNASAVIFKRNAALKVDKEYQNFKSAGDYLFWLLIIEQGYIAHIPIQINFFRKHCNEVTNRMKKAGIMHLELHRIFEILKSKGYIGFFDRISIAIHYIDDIWSTSFNNSDIAYTLVKQWNCHRLLNKYTIKIIKHFMK